MGMKWTLVVCVALCVLVVADSQAQIQVGGILRDEYALGLTPTIKSAGMGGAYIGIDQTFSMNPAALGGTTSMEGTLTYGLYDHDAGPTAHRGRLDAILPFPFPDAVPMLEKSAVRLMLDGFASDGSEPTRLLDGAGNPMDINFDSFTLGLQFGLDVTDWLAVGVGAYPYEKANVDLGPLRGEALSQIGSIQLGTLIRPCEYFHLGAQFIYIKDDLEVGTPGGHMGDYYDIHYYSVGASFMPFDGTLIAVDYWNGEVEGALTKIPATVLFDVDVDRWNLGIQQRVCDYFDVRLGSNNGGITTGFTVHINEKMDLDYAYVNQALRDKENIFGDTEYHAVAFTARF